MYLVNNRSRTQDVPRIFWLLVTARNTMRAAMNLALHQSVKAASYTSLCDYIPPSLYSVSVSYSYCFHNSNMFWLIAGSTIIVLPSSGSEIVQRTFRSVQNRRTCKDGKRTRVETLYFLHALDILLYL